MNTEHVLTFLDLIESKSFNATADRLGVTQSTISSRVRALETELGKRLFARSRAGTSLTTAGVRFQHHARAMQQEWNEAKRSVQGADNFAQSLRIGVQSDIATTQIGEWVLAFRKALPNASFYIEADYSVQMSADLLTGNLDIGIMFAPRHFPELHNERVGDITYRMVSTETDDLRNVRADRYIHANYTPAFSQAHRRVLPHLTGDSPVSCGHSVAICTLLRTLGGTAYVLDDFARDMVARNECQFVNNAQPIVQSVYLAVHTRHRFAPATGKIMRIVQAQFGFS